jgi:hypothetical protein
MEYHMRHSDSFTEFLLVTFLRKNNFIESGLKELISFC